MGVLGDFLSPEAGQKRTKWRNEKADDLYEGLQYYLGPTGVPDKLKAVAELLQFTDAGDVYEAQAGATDIGNARNGWEALEGTGRMLTGMAASVAPVLGAKMANNLTDAGIDWLGSAVDDVMAGYDPAVLRSGVGPTAKADPATTRGQEILDLLSTNPSAVTDDMLDMGDPVLNARLNEYLWNNYDLPMDEASRMARAEGMGADTDAYHGTGYGGFGAFSEDASKIAGATYSDVNPDVANVYARYGDAPQVYPLRMRADNPERFDLLSWEPMRESGAINYAKEQGHDAYYATDGRRIAFNPSNIRSRFARFDPRLAHLRNLNAGLAGLGLGAVLGLQQPSDERELREYLGGT